ncbi:hypothetical protein M527_14135 [Sphingobium indicum IP26]|uniref:Uncharacterized protein n=1 Tax=Sphingobium indicum F2 TaxID=1450518 RepID=A0A8E0WSI2_9SPHN|nr:MULTISPECIES: hypothetical protein [Sphingobium]EPR12093.1 hypothetical protein M527_01880 [Sphingobium indicum IP26]EPR16757.1 hypothetical protein M527_19575 [Sphingobium indicum IP26]EPR18001.1 hypothetical protein M527_14135 [Sphingobium indicum IP26]EQA97571.1 hypothetical protein L286_22430 [Sphingobium sp. HDIP04]KER36611.1 hypothetical protein AL00_10040 [Sphingobium indicum F2]
MSENIYGPIITGSVTVLFIWLFITGFRNGKMEWPYLGITLSGQRMDEPFRFWAVASLIALLIVLLLLGTVGQIVWPHGI